VHDVFTLLGGTPSAAGAIEAAAGAAGIPASAADLLAGTTIAELTGAGG